MNFALDAAIPLLERTPRVMRALLEDVPDEWLHGTEGPETWSPYVIVGHLVHGEKADWIARAQIILAQGDDRKFAPFDRFAQFRESEGKSLTELLDEFDDLRVKNLSTLRSWNISEPQLSLTGIHPAFGEVTLRQLLSTWVAHDLGHIAQTSRVMAKQYREAIGPWRAYLPVMDR